MEGTRGTAGNRSSENTGYKPNSAGQTLTLHAYAGAISVKELEAQPSSFAVACTHTFLGLVISNP